MLHEVDDVLRALLADALPDGVSVDFATPDASWSAGGSTVNLFLVRIGENPAAREGNWREIRDAHGRVTGRQPPPRRYRAGYVLTAWDAEPRVERALLGAALAGLGRCDVVPAELLAGSLADAGQPVAVDVGHPDLTGSAPPWEALGIRPRAYLDVVVTVVAVPPPVTALAAPPDTVDLGIGAPAPDAPAPPGAVPPGAVPRKRVRERG